MNAQKFPTEKLKNFWRCYFTTILTAILTGTSYIPLPPWALFFSYVPLWSEWLLKKPSAITIFKQAWLCQFIYTMIGAHWIAYTAHEFGHLPWPIAIVVLIGFCSFASADLALMALAWYGLRKKLKAPLWIELSLIPILLALFEHYYPMIFPWNMGYPWLWARLPGFQWADVIGFSGLSALTYLFNALSCWAYLEWKKSPARGFTFSALTLGVFLAVNISGYYHRPELSAEQSLKVMIVQANIGNAEKYYAKYHHGFKAAIIHKHFEITEEGLKQSQQTPELTVWPEAAFPQTLSSSDLESHSRLLGDFVRKHHLPLATGAFLADPITGRDLNAFAILTSEGKLTQIPYSKSILLAFGEYFPGAEYFPFLKKIIPEISDFSRGPGPSLQRLGELRIGPQICYEGAFSDFSAELSKLGAQIIVNVTNDSWFGRSYLPSQHLTFTFARSVETRLPVIRATNTGISSVMLPDGTALERSPLHQEWVGHYDVPYQLDPKPTLWTRYQSTYPLVLLGLVIVLSALSVLFTRKERVPRH